MSTRNTVVRSLHDTGAAVWLGGALMGAVALNGAASDIRNPHERAAIAADGWGRWAPINAAAIGAHLIGGLGLILANRDRVRAQSGVSANTAAKTVATALALATTAYSGFLGSRIASAGRVDADSALISDDDTPDYVAAAQDRLRTLQWVTPVLTGLIVVLGAQQGEQQRTSQVLRGRAKKNKGKKNRRG